MLSVSPQIWRLASRKASNIVVLNAGDEVLPLYLIHGMGGDLNGLSAMAQLVGQRFLIKGIQATLSDFSEDLGKSFEEIAEKYVNLILGNSNASAIALGGYSSGAVIALEVAHRLISKGRFVPLLVVIDGAPFNSDAGARPARWQRPIALVRNSFFYVIRIAKDPKYALGAVEHLRNRTRRDIVLPSTGPIDQPSIHRLVGKGLGSGHQAYIMSILNSLLSYKPRSIDSQILVLESRVQPLLHARDIRSIWAVLAGRRIYATFPGHHGSVALSERATIESCAVAIRCALTSAYEQDGTAWNHPKMPAKSASQLMGP